MVCQLCGKRPATVCINIDINGERNVRFICEECAEKRKLKANPSSEEILALVNDIKAREAENDAQKAREETDQNIECPECGMRYGDFVKNHKLGCGGCYIAFRDKLMPLLQKRTKPTLEAVPEEPIEEHHSNRIEILRLKKLLQQSIETEDYENAAKYRDKIAELENSPKEVARGE